MLAADSLSQTYAVVCPSPHLSHCCSVPVPAVGQSGKRDQRCGVSVVKVAEDNRLTLGELVLGFFPIKEVFFGVTHLRLCVGYVKDWKLMPT